MQFDAILFDLDHTLFDSASSELEALDKTFRSNGITPLQGILDLYKSINIDLWKALENEQITLERLRVKRFEDLVSQLDLHADPHALADSYTTNLGLCGKFFDEAETVLNDLQRSTKLGLLSNGVSETQRTRLQVHGFNKYFDAIVISGEFGVAKPNPAIFEEILTRLGTNPDDHILMVGDSLSSDMAGAKLSGISACWFNPSRIELPLDAEVDYVAYSLNDLLEIATG